MNNNGKKSSAICINGALEKFEGPAGAIFPLMAKALSWSPFTKYWVKIFNSAENSLKKLLSLSGSNLSEKEVEPYFKLMGNADHIDGTLALISNWDTENLSDLLNKVTFPVLFLAGARDGIVPTFNSVRASKKTKQSKLVLIKNSGHLLHEEKSQLVVKEIKSFYENTK
jgi:magnesium chelatase accessory protein